MIFAKSFFQLLDSIPVVWTNLKYSRDDEDKDTKQSDVEAIEIEAGKMKNKEAEKKHEDDG